MIINIEQQYGALNISYIGTSGKIEYEKFKIPEDEMFNWEKATSLSKKDPVFKSWDEKSIQKAPCKFISKYRVEELLINADQSVKDKLYTFNTPDIWFCDIEVEVTDDGFPEAEFAKNKVTTICLVVKDKIMLMAINDLPPDRVAAINTKVEEYFSKFNKKFELRYLYFKNEYEMLSTFFGKVMSKCVLLTGWNFIKYDWTYLVNRALRLNIDPKMASPSGMLLGNDRIPEHRPVVDYLELFQKWDRSLKIKDSMSLEAVSSQLLGVAKIKYNGTLKDLYENNYDEYVYYNIVDTILVQLLHEKTNTIGVLFMLSHITKVELIKAFGNVWVTEATLLREFYEDNKVLLKTDKGDIHKDPYEGAYVKDPIPGLYETVVSFDFASLYPTTMRQFNISPETFISKTNIYSPSDDPNIIRTNSGATFDANTESVSKKMLTRYFNQRKQKKTEAFIAETNIEKLQKILETK